MGLAGGGGCFGVFWAVVSDGRSSFYLSSFVQMLLKLNFAHMVGGWWLADENGYWLRLVDRNRRQAKTVLLHMLSLN